MQYEILTDGRLETWNHGRISMLTFPSLSQEQFDYYYEAPDSQVQVH